MEIKDGTIVLNFTETGKGLTSNDVYGYVKGFAIAGSDQKFYWAKASIKDNTVSVFSDQVKTPVAVRYAWADNPQDANLQNVEGLPAAPFRTDNWLDK
jgi:sialate O-acetylesterase